VTKQNPVCGEKSAFFSATAYPTTLSHTDTTTMRLKTIVIIEHTILIRSEVFQQADFLNKNSAYFFKPMGLL
jgi:hypothetical protein